MTFSYNQCCKLKSRMHQLYRFIINARGTVHALGTLRCNISSDLSVLFVIAVVCEPRLPGFLYTVVCLGLPTDKGLQHFLKQLITDFLDQYICQDCGLPCL